MTPGEQTAYLDYIGWKSWDKHTPEQIRILLTVKQSWVEHDYDEKERYPLFELSIVAENFETVWQIYWRKVDKRAARIAYAKHVGSDCNVHEQIAEAIERQTPEMASRPLSKVPHMATWINHRRWEDEDAEMSAASGEPLDGLIQ